MNLFKQSEQEIQLNALRELADGCNRHPAYRAKRKPTAKCKCCERLFDLKRRFQEWERLTKAAWEARMERERKEMMEWSRREEERLNCPG